MRGHGLVAANDDREAHEESGLDELDFDPVPLNLDILGTGNGVDQLTFQLDTFEFLDMDAY